MLTNKRNPTTQAHSSFLPASQEMTVRLPHQWVFNASLSLYCPNNKTNPTVTTEEEPLCHVLYTFSAVVRHYQLLTVIFTWRYCRLLTSKLIARNILSALIDHVMACNSIGPLFALWWRTSFLQDLFLLIYITKKSSSNWSEISYTTEKDGTWPYSFQYTFIPSHVLLKTRQKAEKMIVILFPLSWVELNLPLILNTMPASWKCWLEQSLMGL